MTAPHPAIPARSDSRSRTSPSARSYSQPRSRSVLDVGRRRHTTWWPAAHSSRTTTEPMKPFPPVTKILISSHLQVDLLGRRIALVPPYCALHPDGKSVIRGTADPCRCLPRRRPCADRVAAVTPTGQTACRQVELLAGHLLGPGAAADQAGQERLEGARVDRLDHVLVEAGLERALAIAGLAVAGHRDQAQIVHARERAQAVGQLVAVHERQADVEQRGVRLEA